MRAFITGLDGFAGQWLAKHLLAKGDDVAGGSRNAAPAYTVLSAAEASRISWHQFELADRSSLTSALRASKTDVVYHLAAQSSVSASLANPAVAFASNVGGTSHLIDALGEAAPEAALLYVGSAEVYGSAASESLPLRESTPLRPNNPYAESKALGEAIAFDWGRSMGKRVVATRSFNHIGPGQRTSFAVASFASQIAAIARGHSEPVIRVGNLSPRRDFTDVRDVVRAYGLLVEHGASGCAYNVCSGKGVSMEEIITALVRIARIKIDICVDSARVRPVDTPVSVGDASLLRDTTGWSPEVPLERSLRDLYEWHFNAR